MALTGTVKKRSVGGALVFVVVDFTFSASDYATGGYAFTPAASLGLSGDIFFFAAHPAGGKAVLDYDFTTKKIVAYRTGSGNQTALSEAANGADLSGVTYRCLLVLSQ